MEHKGFVPHINPPLTNPFDIVLIKVSSNVGDPFSLFIHMMSSVSMSSSMEQLALSSPSNQGVTLTNPSLPSINGVGAPSTSPGASTFPIWRVSSIP